MSHECEPTTGNTLTEPKTNAATPSRGILVFITLAVSWLLLYSRLRSTRLFTVCCVLPLYPFPFSSLPPFFHVPTAFS